MNQIRNRNIIDIFSFGEPRRRARSTTCSSSSTVVTMDVYLKRRGRLPPEEAIPMLRGVARALDAAHASGIVPRV